MTARSPFIEHSWRCCALGCKDYLNLKRHDLSEPPDPENRAMYLLLDWGSGPVGFLVRLKRAWCCLRYGQDDWYEFSIEEPYVAREIAAELLLGADALEREQAADPRPVTGEAT